MCLYFGLAADGAYLNNLYALRVSPAVTRLTVYRRLQVVVAAAVVVVVVLVLVLLVHDSYQC